MRVILGFSILFLIGCTNRYRGYLKSYNIVQAEYQKTYIRNHPELTYPLQNIIRKGNLKIGMSKDEVRASIGIPLSERLQGRITEWQYWQRLVVFRDEVLIFFQD